MAEQGRPVGNMIINLSLQGSQFQNALEGINRQVKVAESAMKANLKTLGNAEKSYDDLANHAGNLENVLDGQGKKLDELRKKHQEAVATYGEESKEAAKLALQINNTVSSYSTYERQLKDTRKEMIYAQEGVNKLSNEMKEVEKETNSAARALKSAGDDTGALERQFQGLTRQAELSEKAMEAQRRVVARMADQFGETDDRTEKARKSLQRMESQSRDLSTQLGAVERSMQDVGASATDMQGKFDSAGEKAKGIGGILTAAFTAPLAAISKVGTEVANMVSESELKIKGLMNTTKESAKAIMKDVTESYTSGYSESTTQGAEARARVTAKTGFKGDKAQGIADNSYIISQSTNFEQDEVIDTINTFMKKYDMSEDQAYNEIYRLAENGVTELDEVREYLPLLKDAKFSTNEFSGAIASGIQAGGWSADKIQDFLKEGAIRLNSEDKDVYKGVGLGEEFAKFQKGEMNYTDFLKAAQKEAKGKSQVDQKKLWAAVSGTQGEDIDLATVNATVDGASKGQELNDKKAKEMKEAYDSMPINKFNKAVRELQTSLIPLGTEFVGIGAAVATKVTPYIEKLSKWFSGLNSTTKTTIVVIMSMIAALAPMVAVFGFLLSPIGKMITGFGKFFGLFKQGGAAANGFSRVMSGVSTVFSKISGVVSKLAGVLTRVLSGALKLVTRGVLTLGRAMLMNPIGLVITAIVALAAGFVIAYKRSETFRNFVNKLGTAIKGAVKWVKDFASAIVSLFKGDTAKGSKLLDKLGLSEGAVSKIKSTISGIKKVFSSLVSGVKEMFGGVKKVFSGFANGDMKKVWEGIRQVFSGYIKIVRTLVLNSFIGRIVTAIAGFVTTLIGKIKNLWTRITGSFRDGASNVGKRVTDFKNSVVSKFTSLKDSTVGKIKTLWTNLTSSFTSGIRTVFNKVSDFKTNMIGKFTDIKDGVIGKFKDMLTYVKGIPDKMSKGLSDGKGALKDGAKKLGNGLIEGIEWGVNKAIGGVNWVLNKLGSDSKVATWSAPKFAKGTPTGGHKGGLARIGDGNQHELVILPDGNAFMSPNRDTLVNLPKATQVISGPNTAKLFANGGIPAFAKGTGFWNAALNSGKKAWDGAKAVGNAVSSKSKAAYNKVTDWSSEIWDWMESKASIKNLLLNRISGEKMTGLTNTGVELAKGSVKKAVDAAKDYLFKQSEEGIGGGGPAPAGKGVQRWAATVRKALAMNGLPTTANYVNAWLRQIASESGGNEKAIQSTAVKDINYYTGNLARGLVQVIPPTFRAYAFPGHKNQMNGLDSLLAGINYAKSRYGAKKMLNYIGKGHGYSNGGMATFDQLARIGEGNNPEMIIPLSKAKRSRGLQLLNQSANIMGVSDKLTNANSSPNNEREHREQMAAMKEQIDLLAQMVQLNQKLLLKDSNTYLDGKELYQSNKSYENKATLKNRIARGTI